MNQKDFSYSKSKLLKSFGDVKDSFIKNPPFWAILWAAQKGMLTEGSYSVKVSVNGNALDFFVEKDTEPTNLVIEKFGTEYHCTAEGKQKIVLSPRERVVNGVTEKWHTRIR